MEANYIKNISNFFIAGINYKKSDASSRGRFAISHDQYFRVLSTATQQGLTELFILSTCNRTEIYGFAESGKQLAEILCSETEGDTNSFLGSAYIKSGMEAVAHLFYVGAGLDSQILGDYEIVGQLKMAVKFAKENRFVGHFTERLVNCVLQASKQIKNQTALSSGTVSVSFAAVQYIRTEVAQFAEKNILLLGVGKIGRNTCRNIVDYLETKNITLLNRSAGKAEELAQELGLRSSHMDQLAEEIDKADIILVATNATEPVILQKHLQGKSQKLIIDLSIPYNVEKGAQHLSNVCLVNVDELSKLKDETLKLRQAEIPKAKLIIAHLITEFEEWCEMRRHVPLLKDLKLKLKTLYAHPQNPGYLKTCPKTMDTQIQRVLNDTAGQIKMKNQRGCQYIAALNNFISVKN